MALPVVYKFDIKYSALETKLPQAYFVKLSKPAAVFNLSVITLVYWFLTVFCNIINQFFAVGPS